MAASLPCVVSDWNGYKDEIAGFIDTVTVTAPAGYRAPATVSATKTLTLRLGRKARKALRRFFEIDESRLRANLYLHQGLDLAAAIAFWSALTRIPPAQFVKPYRAVPDPSIRHAKHVHGCVTVSYSCSTTHRSVMGLVSALLSNGAIPG